MQAHPWGNERPEGRRWPPTQRPTLHGNMAWKVHVVITSVIVCVPDVHMEALRQ